MSQKTYNIISIILIVLLIGFCIFLGVKLYSGNQKYEVNIEKEKQTIERLNDTIAIYQDSVNAIKSKVEYIKSVVVIEKIKEIEKLPIDSNTMLLKENLVEYGELSTDSDSYPQILKTSEDTVVLISENNVKDVNIITAKYEGELEINNNLNTVIELDSVMLCKKDSIILMKDSIITKDQIAFDNNMRDLKKQLKKSRVTGGVIGGTLGILATTLLIILCTK